MPSGDTVVSSLADSLDTVVAKARIITDYEPRVAKVVDRERLEKNTGTAWIENRLERITAQSITESTVLDNPQELTDTTFSISPTYSGIMTRITKRTQDRVSRRIVPLLGEAAGRAMTRKLEEDGIAQFTAASTTLAGTGQTLNSGFISAGVARIRGNTTEAGTGAGDINVLLHSFGIKDLQDEVVQGIGTYVVPEGLSAEMFRRGFNGTLFGANIWDCDEIDIVAADARGWIGARKALVLVEGAEMKRYTRFRPDVGGGADEVFLYHEYAFGERQDAWHFSILHDATAPVN